MDILGESACFELRRQPWAKKRSFTHREAEKERETQRERDLHSQSLFWCSEIDRIGEKNQRFVCAEHKKKVRVRVWFSNDVGYDKANG